MNHSPAMILSRLLEEASDAPFTAPTDNQDWPLYIATHPDERKASGCVRDTAGVKLGRLMSGTHLMVHGFQLTIRSESFTEGWSKAQEVWDLLEVCHNQEVEVDEDEYLIDSINLTSPILPLGQDEKRRYLFTLNGLIMFGSSG